MVSAPAAKVARMSVSARIRQNCMKSDVRANPTFCQQGTLLFSADFFVWHNECLTICDSASKRDDVKKGNKWI